MKTEAGTPPPLPASLIPPPEPKCRESLLEGLPVIRVDAERRSMQFQWAEKGVALYGDRLMLFRRRRWSWIFANIVLATPVVLPVLLFVLSLVMMLIERFTR